MRTKRMKPGPKPRFKKKFRIPVVLVSEQMYKDLRFYCIKNKVGFADAVREALADLLLRTFTEIREFEIWSEGYIATGQSGPAVLHGKATGKNFKDACKRFAEFNPDFKKDFDAKRMTQWGCRLFDNERDARKRYG